MLIVMGDVRTYVDGATVLLERRENRLVISSPAFIDLEDLLQWLRTHPEEIEKFKEGK